MKHGKRLTLYEKLLLKEYKHNPEDYLRVKRANREYKFVHKQTGETLTIQDGRR